MVFSINEVYYMISLLVVFDLPMSHFAIYHLSLSYLEFILFEYLSFDYSYLMNVDVDYYEVHHIVILPLL